MIWMIFKWIAIIILIIWFLGLLKHIFLYMLYRTNKAYRNFIDCELATQISKDIVDKKNIEEQKRQETLSMLMAQWGQTAQYYYYYYEKGVLLSDYAYMLDLLTQKIITLLGGDYSGFRNQIGELLKGKEITDGRKKELTDKGIPPLPKDITPRDFEKRNMTDDDINKLLDDWERRIKKPPEDPTKHE